MIQFYSTLGDVLLCCKLLKSNDSEESTADLDRQTLSYVICTVSLVGKEGRGKGKACPCPPARLLQPLNGFNW